MRIKQNTLPPHIPSQPFHEVEVCRGKEVSEAKVTMARDRLVNIGILPSDNSTKQKRAGKVGINVCSRIIRLMNNQTQSRRKAIIPTKVKATTRMLWLL